MSTRNFSAQLSGARYASEEYESLEKQERFLRAVIEHMTERISSKPAAQFGDVAQTLQLVLDKKVALYESFVTTYFKPAAK